MNEQQKLASWAKLRSKGLLRFILEVGILRVGLPATVLTRAIVYVLEYGFTTSHLATAFSGVRVLIFVGNILLTGVVFSLLLWYLQERKYRQRMQ